MTTISHPPALTDEDRHRQRVNLTTQLLSSAQRATTDLFQHLASTIHLWNASQGFWESTNSGEKFMLMVSEIAEAMEADRKNLTSDHIPEFTGIEEELADTLIRIFDFAGHHSLRLPEAFFAKLAFNLTRPYKHGKKY